MEYEARGRRADGEYRWFLIRAVPMRDKRGSILQWYGVMIDIEDRKRAEQERETLRADLAHVNRVTTMGELTASFAHEIKQPIAATVFNAQACLRWLMGDQPDLDEVREAADRIVRDGNRASDIIERLRSLYKKSPPKRELVEVNEIVQEMVGLLRGEANRYAVSIRTDLAVDLPKITADRVQLQQVLMNLMLNAIEAMKETGGVLTVKSQLDQRRPSDDLGERHRSGPAGREGGRNLQCVLYHQTAGLRHGPGDQPFHRRVAWRPSMGNTQRRTGRYVSFHFADHSRSTKSVRYRNVIPTSLGRCRGHTDRGMAGKPIATK